MSEVYRARDLELGREVAVKALPEAWGEDRERVERFEREAQLLAALRHPNIAVIHGLERDGTKSFLVLELIPGESLADRLARGPLSFAEARPIFLQIAQALEAAHEKGIIHPDLKPANAQIQPDGTVKLLDFGLGKDLRPQSKLIGVCIDRRGGRRGESHRRDEYFAVSERRGEGNDRTSAAARAEGGGCFKVRDTPGV